MRTAAPISMFTTMKFHGSVGWRASRRYGRVPNELVGGSLLIVQTRPSSSTIFSVGAAAIIWHLASAALSSL